MKLEWQNPVIWVAASAIAACLGVVVAAFQALSEWSKSRKQHEDELRWKRSELALRALDAMNADALAKNALTMLDWDNREFAIESGGKASVRFDDVSKALRINTSGKLEFSDTECFIRDSFDHLAEHLQRIKHLIDIGLISLEDVKNPLRYWARRMAHKDFCNSGDPIRTFLKSYDYDLALKLIDELRSGDGLESNTN